MKPELARYGSVYVVDTEHKFREWITHATQGSKEWLDMIVLEQQVRWTHSAPIMPPAPQVVREEGYANAGVRCYEYVRQAQEAVKIPVIFYTIGEPKDISSLLNARGFKEDWRDYQCIEKESSFDKLHEALRRLVEL